MKKDLPVFTLGVEEEYLIIDPQTRDLRSHMSKIVDGAKIILQEQVKAEMHQSVVEVGTNICKNVKEAREEITFLRKKIVELAANQGLVVRAAGTHPFSKWQDQPITDDPRYHMIVNELQDAARSKSAGPERNGRPCRGRQRAKLSCPYGQSRPPCWWVRPRCTGAVARAMRPSRRSSLISTRIAMTMSSTPTSV